MGAVTNSRTPGQAIAQLFYNLFNYELRITNYELRIGRSPLRISVYTKPRLRDRIKQQILNGSKGGAPGQWSARKAQLVAQRYRASGGGYKKGGLRQRQRSLKRWTKERWRTNSGQPSLQTGERYLPDRAWKRLTPAQKAATNRAKRAGMRKGRQFVANPPAAKRASQRARVERLRRLKNR